MCPQETSDALGIDIEDPALEAERSQ